MRTVRKRLYIFSIICLFTLSIPAGTGVQAQPLCSVTPAIKVPRAVNIFNIQQERILGDVEAEDVESVYPTVHDEGFEAYLNAVVLRLRSQFPPDQFRVRVWLIDSPEANAFSVGPDRIYVTRKMVAVLKNEDELAGLLGHELGHIQLHQNAITVSYLFHAILRANSVSDRKDISDKFSGMLQSMDRDPKMLRKAAQIIELQEGINESAADRVSMYAVAAAGFSPRATVELLKRSAATNGNSGSLLKDFLGASTSNERRLREINEVFNRLPRACRERVPTDSVEFRTWQASVMSHPDWAAR